MLNFFDHQSPNAFTPPDYVKDPPRYEDIFSILQDALPSSAGRERSSSLPTYQQSEGTPPTSSWINWQFFGTLEQFRARLRRPTGTRGEHHEVSVEEGLETERENSVVCREQLHVDGGQRKKNESNTKRMSYAPRVENEMNAASVGGMAGNKADDNKQDYDNVAFDAVDVADGSKQDCDSVAYQRIEERNGDVTNVADKGVDCGATNEVLDEPDSVDGSPIIVIKNTVVGNESRCEE